VRRSTHAYTHDTTLDFANAFLSPGVNRRAGLVPSPWADARNGASRRWLGDKIFIDLKISGSFEQAKSLYKIIEGFVDGNFQV
jgi:hypothetical protein